MLLGNLHALFKVNYTALSQTGFNAFLTRQSESRLGGVYVGASTNSLCTQTEGCPYSSRLNIHCKTTFNSPLYITLEYSSWYTPSPLTSVYRSCVPHCAFATSCFISFWYKLLPPYPMRKILSHNTFKNGPAIM